MARELAIPYIQREVEGLNLYPPLRKLKINELPVKEEIILHCVLSPAVRAGLLEMLPAYDLPPRTPPKKSNLMPFLDLSI